MKKIKIHQYDFKNNIQKTWDSLQEINDCYYNGIKYSLFVKGNIYHKLPDNTYITKKLYKAHDLNKLITTSESIYVKLSKETKRTKNKEIEVFNLNNEKIAEFKNVRIAAELTSIPSRTISAQLDYAKGKRLNRTELIFKYKE